MKRVGVWKENGRLKASSSAELCAEMERSRATLKDTMREHRVRRTSLRLTQCFDGVWAEWLQKSVQDFGATELEITDPWVLVGPNWECPCCGREKKDLIFKSGNALIAKAVDHHDHFRDYINDRMRQVLGNDWGREYPHASEIQKDGMSSLLAFAPVLICEHCNSADKQGKDGVRAELGSVDLEYFSFAVEEIRLFIRARPNQPHEVFGRKAARIFKERGYLETLAGRKHWVDEQLEMLRKGTHWRSREEYPSSGDMREIALARAHELGMAVVSTSNFDIFDYSRTSGGSKDKTEWRHESKKKKPKLSTKECLDFIDSHDDLREVGPNWRCPACQRSLRNIVRTNSSGELYCCLGVLGPVETMLIVCMDCDYAATGMAGEAEIAREKIGCGDFAAAIYPRIHNKHKVKSERIWLAHLKSIRGTQGTSVEVPNDDTEDEGFASIGL